MVSMWDLERTTSWLVGQCVRNLLIGPKSGRTENAFGKWLDSPLFLGGLAQQQGEDKTETKQGKDTDLELTFLHEMIQKREGSLGNQVFEDKWKQLPDIFDRFGGEAVDEVMRWFVAVSLRHLGLVGFAIQREIKPEAAHKLTSVWKEAKQLRKWIVHERQRIANEISEKLKEKQAQEKKEGEAEAVSEGTNPESENSLEKQVDKSSYEYICECIVSKLKLLFHVVPCLSLSASVTLPNLLHLVSGKYPCYYNLDSCFNQLFQLTHSFAIKQILLNKPPMFLL